MFKLETDKSKWVQLNERKWELKHNGVVLATISYRPQVKYKNLRADARYSAYFSIPKIFKNAMCDNYKTFTFDTFEEAIEAVDQRYAEVFMPWLEAFLDHYQLGVQKIGK